jgi:hypothetical protein
MRFDSVVLVLCGILLESTLAVSNYPEIDSALGVLDLHVSVSFIPALV